MYSINKQALELVREELKIEIDSLIVVLDQSSPIGDMEPLVTGLGHVNGVFSLLQMVGGVSFVTEIMALLHESAEDDELPEKHWDVVVNAIKLLPGYFQQIQYSEKDNPLL